jgi:hypothetical protein
MVPKSPPHTAPTPRTALDDELVVLFRRFREDLEARGELPPLSHAPSSVTAGERREVNE